MGCGLSREGLDAVEPQDAPADDENAGGAGGAGAPERPDEGALGGTGGAPEGPQDEEPPPVDEESPPDEEPPPEPPPSDEEPPPEPPPATGWQAGAMVIGVGMGGRRASSADGVTWSTDQQDDRGNRDSSIRSFHDAAYAQGLLVAVGGGCQSFGCVARIATFDGKTWTDRTVPSEAGRLRGVAFGEGVWVVVGDQGPVAFSTDGKAWVSARARPNSRSLSRVAFGHLQSGGARFIAVGAGSLRVTSRDGRDWEAPVRDEGAAAVDLADVTVAGGVAVAVGRSGRRMRSTDGLSWGDRAGGGGDMFAVVHHAGEFFAYSRDGLVYRSNDGGRGWTPVTLINGPDATIAVGRLQERTLFVGSSWPGARKTSGNGIAFDNRGPSRNDDNGFTRFVFAGGG